MALLANQIAAAVAAALEARLPNLIAAAVSASLKGSGPARNDYSSKRTAEPKAARSVKSNESKAAQSTKSNEEQYRDLFELHTGFGFPKAKPSWMHPLTLSGYCEEQKIAFVYYSAGRDNAYDPKSARKTQRRFEEQQLRDEERIMQCHAQGIWLYIARAEERDKEQAVISAIKRWRADEPSLSEGPTEEEIQSVWNDAAGTD